MSIPESKVLPDVGPDPTPGRWMLKDIIFKSVDDLQNFNSKGRLRFHVNGAATPRKEMKSAHLSKEEVLAEFTVDEVVATLTFLKAYERALKNKTSLKDVLQNTGDVFQ